MRIETITITILIKMSKKIIKTKITQTNKPTKTKKNYYKKNYE